MNSFQSTNLTESHSSNIAEKSKETLWNQMMMPLSSSNESNISLETDCGSFAELLNQHNQILSEVRQEQAYYASSFSVIMLLSVIGNFLVCKVCLTNWSRTNALILSLAVSDLLMTLFSIPFNLFRAFNNYSWPFGATMCFLVNFVQHLVVYNSSFTMTVIAMQRYYSVCCSPQLQPQQTTLSLLRQLGRLSTRKTISVIIVFIWILAGALSLLFTYNSTTVVRQSLFSILFQDYIISQNENPLDSERRENASTVSFLREEKPFSEEEMLMHRCTNPVSPIVSRFFQANDFPIQAELVESTAVFLTQYFIPLSIAAYLYLSIGRTIFRHSQLVKQTGMLHSL